MWSFCSLEPASTNHNHLYAMDSKVRDASGPSRSVPVKSATSAAEIAIDNDASEEQSYEEGFEIDWNDDDEFSTKAGVGDRTKQKFFKQRVCSTLL